MYQSVEFCVSYCYQSVSLYEHTDKDIYIYSALNRVNSFQKKNMSYVNKTYFLQEDVKKTS